MLTIEQEVKTMMQSVDSDGLESAAKRLSEFFVDLGQAMSFMASRSEGSILGLDAGQRVDRWGLTVRLSERVRRDTHFRRELFRHPRYMSTIAVQEGFGINPLGYLWQIKAVNIVEEEPGLHWLVLPVCHRGCELRGTMTPQLSTGSCHMCGKPFGQADASPATSSYEESPESGLCKIDDLIHQVDEFIVRSVQANVSSRARLLSDPTGFFAEACQARLGVCAREELGIRELRVAVETDSLLYLILLANPKSNTHQLVEGK